MINSIQNRLQLLQSNQLKIDQNDNKNKKFVDMLKKNIDKVNNMQIEADQKTEDFVLGKTDNIHEVMVATEKAETSMKLTLAVQNKVVDAYKEIMRMQV